MATLLSQFGIRLPGDLVVLSRALVTLDGTLRVLAPDVSLVAAATEMMTSTTAPADRPRRDDPRRARWPRSRICAACPIASTASSR